MDKLKNLLKSDTPTSDNPAVTGSTSSGKISGQGSHFRGKEEETLGSTVTGTDPSTRGPADVSAATTNPTSAATTAGPEQGSSGHVNTASTYTQPSTQREIQDYSVSSADLPKTETTRDGSGTAAIGQTSTYTSTPLSQGNPTSSIVDSQSSDPLTYKKPEAGVGAGAAATAAGLAFNAGEERKKSELGGAENPYRTTSLDPRVDGLSKSSASAATSNVPTSTASTTTAIGTGLAGAGATSAYSSSSAQHEVAAPSSLTTAADPVDRSAEYSASTGLKGLGTSSTEESTLQSTEPEQNRQSVVGRVLGAVGLGSVAGALGAGAATSRDDTALAETPDEPTTTTGLTSYTAPTQQGAPTSHHRKESIPTTAYPSATFDSPRAINQPIGGAGSPVVHGDRDNTGSGVATGVAAGGAAAVGAHEYENSKSLREGISGEPHGSAPVLKEAGDTTATTDVDPARYGEAQGVRANISEQPSTGIASTHHATTVDEGTSALAPSAAAYNTEKAVEQSYTAPATTSTASTAVPTTTSTTASTLERPEEKDHATRDTAIGAGAGAAAVGAGAYGAHEYSKREAEKAETEAAKERAAHEKELAKQKAAQEKELEKQHKSEEKAAAKEEKHHQKELEKEEKHHQKELEKEEKEREKEAKHQAELAAVRDRREKERAQALLQKQREEEAFERRNSGQRQGLVGATETEDKKVEKEKKPSIFKRIFKRRKNKDTGESEDYSSADEDSSHHKAAYGAAVVGTGAGVAGAKAAEDRGHYTALDPQDPKNQEAKDHYAAQLMGVGGTTATMKEDEFKGYAASHPTGTSTYDETGPTAVTTGTTGTTSEAVTGLPYDASKDPEAAHRLSQHTHGTGIGTYDRGDAAAVTAGAHEPVSTTEKSIAPSTLDSTGTRSLQPTEAVTGTPAATGTTGQIVPATVESTGYAAQQPTGAVTGLPHSEKATAPETTSTASGTNTTYTSGEPAKNESVSHAAAEGTSGNLPISTDFTLGEIVDPKHEKHTETQTEEASSGGLGQKLKNTFQMGGLEP